nr:MAG TPA: hypothetical protein [Caudoviricetes sp.]
MFLKRSACFSVNLFVSNFFIVYSSFLSLINYKYRPLKRKNLLFCSSFYNIFIILNNN